VQDEYLEFLAALGVDADPMEWGLGPTPDECAWREREFFPRTDRPYAAFVIGTSKAEKDWFADRWARLADVLAADFGLQAVLVGGQSPRELETAAQIARHAAPRPVVNALGSGLRRLVAILDGAALVVSPDTGPLHMAVATGRPTISLMGYTNPKRTGPYRRFHDLMVDAYGDPGEDYPLDHRTRAGRMSRIRVDDVVSRVDLWRSRYAQ
jgi:heptosyltransferase I